MNPDGKEQIWQSKETLRALPSGHRFLLGYTSCFLQKRDSQRFTSCFDKISGCINPGRHWKNTHQMVLVELLLLCHQSLLHHPIQTLMGSPPTFSQGVQDDGEYPDLEKKMAMLGLRSHSSSLWCIIFRLFMTTPSLLKMFFSVFFTASQDHGCLYCAAKQREKCGNKVNQQHFV